MTLTGKLISSKTDEEIELRGNEKSSFSKFLDGKSEKTVNLERIIGIGGEGIVLAQKMDIRENHYKNGWYEEKGKDVALKFVEFHKNDKEDFLEPEKQDARGLNGGINGSGKWVSLS